MSRLRRRLLVLVGMVAVVLGTVGAPAAAAAPAPAAERSTESTLAGWPKITTRTSDATASSCPITMYGYRGTVMCEAIGLEIEWSPGRLEYFDIAPNRTIWHVWPNSGGWKVMPGNGHADHLYDAYWSGSSRIVCVSVTSNGSVWCSTDPSGTASWGAWWRRS